MSKISVINHASSKIHEVPASTVCWSCQLLLARVTVASHPTSSSVTMTQTRGVHKHTFSLNALEERDRNCRFKRPKEARESSVKASSSKQLLLRSACAEIWTADAKRRVTHRTEMRERSAMGEQGRQQARATSIQSALTEVHVMFLKVMNHITNRKTTDEARNLTEAASRRALMES
jgi:hypothetical protein